MNLKTLSKEELLTQTHRLVREERETTTAVLWRLMEIERRLLFAEAGCSSLFEFCVRELRYSESAAYRRITGMRLLRDVPAIEEKIESGKLSLSTASQVQCYRTKNRISKEQTAVLIENVEGKSAREVEKQLKPEVVGKLISFNADEECLTLLRRIEEIKGHTDYNSLIKMMAKLVLTKIEPKEPKHESLPTSEVKSRRPSAEMERHVRKRDNHQCAFIDEVTKQRCRSRYRLEIDHCLPVALGGKTEVGNLRLVCRAHNALYAIQQFGLEKINTHRKAA